MGTQKEGKNSPPFQDIRHVGACRKTPGRRQNRRPMPTNTSVFALPDRLAAKSDPSFVAADEQHFRRIEESLAASIAEISAQLDAARLAPAGEFGAAVERDVEVRTLSARLRTLGRYGLDLCLGRMLPSEGAGQETSRARLHRTPRPHRLRRRTPARRLALARRRAVLRRDPRQPDGSREPTPLPLDQRTHHRLLGRGVRPRPARERGRVGGARRPIRVHREPRREPVESHAGCARHDPVGPGCDHPGRVARCARRRRRTRHRQDGRRAAPVRVPALRRPAHQQPRLRAALRRAESGVHGLRRRRAPEPRRGWRAAGHDPRARRGGSGGDRRDRLRRSPRSRRPVPSTPRSRTP